MTTSDREFYQIFLSFSILSGTDSFLLTTPSMGCVAHWFKNRRGLSCFALSAWHFAEAEYHRAKEQQQSGEIHYRIHEASWMEQEPWQPHQLEISLRIWLSSYHLHTRLATISIDNVCLTSDLHRSAAFAYKLLASSTLLHAVASTRRATRLTDLADTTP